MIRTVRFLTAAVAIISAMLACGTTVLQTAYYVCPTPVPTAVIPQPTPLPGTPLPLPTLLPLPPTPYVITPPQDFYVGDADHAGRHLAGAWLCRESARATIAGRGDVSVRAPARSGGGRGVGVVVVGRTVWKSRGGRMALCIEVLGRLLQHSR